MTDPSPDPLDELASAHLDGLTTPEEEARVAADPAMSARVEALRAVRTAVASVHDTDPEVRATTVAAVLARLDEGGEVTPIAPVRRDRSRARRLLAVAAAAVAVAVLIPLLVQQDHSDPDLDTAAGDSSATTLAPSPLQSEAADDPASGQAAPSSGGAPSTTIAGELPDLGAFATVAALRAAVEAEDRDATAFNADDQDRRPSAPCGDDLETRPAVRPVGRARLRDRPVLVFVDEGGAVLVLDAATCIVATDDPG